MIPGEIRVAGEPIELNVGRERQAMVVVNDGDRPIQVGSHLHFCDANPALTFDRVASRGFRLAIPAGTSVRFEPGVSKSVELVALGGAGRVPGIQIRSAAEQSDEYERMPRPVVPFGTPGSLVPDSDRATSRGKRISDEPAGTSDPSRPSDSSGTSEATRPEGSDRP